MCENFKKDYKTAVRIALGGDVYWEWVCAVCGQIYREKCKEPIIIKD